MVTPYRINGDACGTHNKTDFYEFHKFTMHLKPKKLTILNSRRYSLAKKNRVRTYSDSIYGHPSPPYIVFVRSAAHAIRKQNDYSHSQYVLCRFDRRPFIRWRASSPRYTSTRPAVGNYHSRPRRAKQMYRNENVSTAQGRSGAD